MYSVGFLNGNYGPVMFMLKYMMLNHLRGRTHPHFSDERKRAVFQKAHCTCCDVSVSSAGISPLFGMCGKSFLSIALSVYLSILLNVR